MSPSGGSIQHNDPPTAMYPSPARESLRNNLDVDYGVGAVVELKKKRSWIAGLRNMVSRGASYGKTTADSSDKEESVVES